MAEKPSYEELEKRVAELEHAEQERERCERELIRYQNIVSSMEDVVAFVGKDYRYVVVNQAYERFSGRKYTEFIGHKVAEYLGEATFENVVKPRFDRCLKGERIQYQEWFDFPNIGKRFVDVAYHPYRDENGMISGVIVNGKDITEKKKIEANLSESERRYGLLFKSIKDAIVVVDTERKIIDYNHAFETMFGYDRNEIIGKNTSMLYSDLSDYRDVGGDLIEKYSEGEVIRNIELRKKDGSVFVGDAGVFFLKDENEVLLGYISLIRDISDRIRTGEALRYSNERLNALIQSSPMAIIVLDSEGIVTLWNPAAEEMFGWKQEEVLGRFLPIVPEDKKEEHGQLRKRVLSGEGFRDVEVARQRKDGSEIHISVYTVPLRDSSGNISELLSVNVDVTGRKRATEALKQGKARLEVALAAAQMGQWEWNVRDNEVFFSELWKKQLGYEDHELPSRFEEWENRLHPDDHARVMCALDDYLEGLVPEYALEFRLRHKDGSYRWIYTRAEKIFDEAGELAFILGGHLDITPRKEAEGKLQDALVRQHEAVRAGKVGLWDWDLASNKVDYSREWKAQIGYEEHEIGDDFEEWESRVHPDDLESTLDRIRTSIVEMRQDHEVEFRFRHKDGSYRWILTQASILQDESGRAKRMVGSHVDITELKAAEEALRSSRSTLKAALDSMMDAVFISDAHGRFVEFNEAFATFHRLASREDCFEALPEWTELLEVFSPDGSLVPPDMWVVPRALRGETGLNDEYVLRRKDTGQTWTGSYNYAPIFDARGGIAGSVVVARDITEQKKMEERLRQSHKMEAVGNLAGGIAHEFNNVLGIIIGNTELALADLEKWHPVSENLEEIKLAAMRARDVVKQLLTFSRKMEVKREPIDIRVIIKESLKLLRAAIPSTVRIDDSLPEKIDAVSADPTQIHQLMINLCNNGAQAMGPGGGSLFIGLENMLLDEEAVAKIPGLDPGPHVRLSVSDTGKGMSGEVLDQIFEPYFTTKEVGKGTGMGLAVVHGIVQANLGAIEVESEVGSGTTFHVYFPSSPEKAYRIERREEKPLTGKERILFVDDEPPIAKMGSKILEQLGYSVTSETDPLRALEIFRPAPHAFDLVITDMTMPNLTGDLLAMELRKIRPDLPIVICTGYSEKISKKEAGELGARAFLIKPVERSVLARTIREILDTGKKSPGL